MDRLGLLGILSLISVLACSQTIASCSEPSARPTAVEPSPVVRSSVAVYARVPAPPAVVVLPPRASLDLPDACRRLVYRRGSDGEQRLSKERAPWLNDKVEREARQVQLRELIFAVAEEMGADETAAEMIWRKAIYESSGDASNVHLLNPDQKANRVAAAKGKRRATERWRDVEVVVYEQVDAGLVPAGEVDAWALGRGLYGQVTGLHMHRWSADAPPWSLCDPVVATVTMIWAMRAGLEECHSATLRDAYRRFSSGKCAERSADLEGRFDRLARGRVRGLKLEPFDPDARAELGERWPEETTDREVLLGVLRAATGKSPPP